MKRLKPRETLANKSGERYLSLRTQDISLEDEKTHRRTLIRRVLISISLLPYLFVWSFLFYAVHTVTEDESDAAFAFGLLSAAGLTFLPYFIFYTVKLVSNTGISRKDYVFAWLTVILPLCVAIVEIKCGFI